MREFSIINVLMSRYFHNVDMRQTIVMENPILIKKFMQKLPGMPVAYQVSRDILYVAVPDNFTSIAVIFDETLHNNCNRAEET
ncbi:MAG: hypothetical protein QXI52_06560 [Nitrososphaerota archaeon]